jgi:transposase InsO family protein
MPWQERSKMAERQDFVAFAQREDANIARLCRDFKISRKTGYKWLARAATADAVGWADHSRRPHTSPRRTAADLEAQIVALRMAHPAWGGRKLHHWLVQHGQGDVPAPSTITDILHRHGLITPDPAAPRRLQCFEHAAPNDLWQLDFMGHRPLTNGQRVHPLTLADDHSRFALGLVACPHERGDLVQALLTACFQRYGLPTAILTDNGPPWGATGRGGITALEAWLLRLGIDLWHGRVYHPQTQGKVERLHGTLAAEVFAFRAFPDLAACQPAFDAFRTTYNHERPHQALGYAVPASRYQPSPRPFPATLPNLSYGPDDQVRLVRAQGAISFHNRSWFISRGLIGLPVAVRPTTTDSVFQVVYCQREVAQIDLRDLVEV